MKLGHKSSGAIMVILSLLCGPGSTLLSRGFFSLNGSQTLTSETLLGYYYPIFLCVLHVFDHIG